MYSDKNLALAVYYTRQNRYSFHALLGAWEINDNHCPEVYFFFQEKELLLGLGEILDAYRKVVLLFSFFTTQVWDVLRLIKRLKERYSERVICIAGGPHPTASPQDVLGMGFDIVVRGEGEESFPHLLERLSNGEDIRSLRGIVFKEKGEIYSTPQGPFLDLDKYPPFSLKYRKFGPIEITRGCPFGCYFCQTPSIFGTRVRHRSIENICRYIEILTENNLKDIRFISPNAFSYGSPDGKVLNLSALETLLREARRVNPEGKIFFGSFPSEVRPEHVNEETIGLVLRYADNDNLVIGAQSGSQRVLDLCHRGHNVNDIYRAVRLTLESGLRANVDFIFGLPPEKEEDIEITSQVIRDLAKMGARIHAHTFLPLPQTPFFEPFLNQPYKSTVDTVEKNIPTGILFGDWREQDRIAERICGYFGRRGV